MNTNNQVTLLKLPSYVHMFHQYDDYLYLGIEVLKRHLLLDDSSMYLQSVFFKHTFLKNNKLMINYIILYTQLIK